MSSTGDTNTKLENMKHNYINNDDNNFDNVVITSIDVNSLVHSRNYEALANRAGVTISRTHTLLNLVMKKKTKYHFVLHYVNPNNGCLNAVHDSFNSGSGRDARKKRDPAHCLATLIQELYKTNMHQINYIDCDIDLSQSFRILPMIESDIIRMYKNLDKPIILINLSESNRPDNIDRNYIKNFDYDCDFGEDLMRRLDAFENLKIINLIMRDDIMNNIVWKKTGDEKFVLNSSIFIDCGTSFFFNFC